MPDDNPAWRAALLRGVAAAGEEAIVFGSAAIALHGLRLHAVSTVRTPEDIDIFGRAPSIAACLIAAGYVRTAPREFRSTANDQWELPIHLWDSTRDELPAGVPPCMENPTTFHFTRQAIRGASLDDLLLMKQLLCRPSQEKRSKDKEDRRVIRVLIELGGD